MLNKISFQKVTQNKLNKERIYERFIDNRACKPRACVNFIKKV